MPLLMCRGAAIISFSAASIRLRSRMRPQCLAFALVVAVLRVAPAASWWGVAHMLTAQVAKDTLPEATVKCVQKQLDRDYYPDYSSFITAALWSDHIKTSKPPFGLNYDGGTRAYDEWHFIDFPFSSSASYTCNTKKEENVVWALDRLTTRAGRRELTSKGP